jgi:hypothetical protein
MILTNVSMNDLKSIASNLGMSKEYVKTFGKLTMKATWISALQTYTPDTTTEPLNELSTPTSTNTNTPDNTPTSTPTDSTPVLDVTEPSPVLEPTPEPTEPTFTDDQFLAIINDINTPDNYLPIQTLHESLPTMSKTSLHNHLYRLMRKDLVRLSAGSHTTPHEWAIPQPSGSALFYIIVEQPPTIEQPTPSPLPTPPPTTHAGTPGIIMLTAVILIAEQLITTERMAARFIRRLFN